MKSNDMVVEFFEAAESNDIAKVGQLIKEKGVDVNSRDNNNEDRTILHIAALKGFEDLIRLLVEQYDADINIEDKLGEVPLHVAVDNHHIQIARYLVEKGSDYSEDVVDILGSSEEKDL